MEGSLVHTGKMSVAFPKDNTSASGACPAAVWDLFKWQVDPGWLKDKMSFLSTLAARFTVFKF